MEEYLKKNELQFYIILFKNLHRDNKNGGAPHKPILLLSIIESFNQFFIKDENVFIKPEIVGLFKDFWKLLVSSNHTMSFVLPFFHMRSEPFWELIPNVGYEKLIESKSQIRSFNYLIAAVRCARIDKNLLSLLKDEKSRLILKAVLLKKYFPYSDIMLMPSDSYGYLSEIKEQIINKDSNHYKVIIGELRKKLDEENFQEELFVRGNLFKREIPKLYNYACCISGMRIDSTLNISMIDACHIIPFSLSNDDTITNGIALCPNLHRAFDRGLLTIIEDYTVRVSKIIVEKESEYSIKKFDGKKIILPEEQTYWPSNANLVAHNKQYFKQLDI